MKPADIERQFGPGETIAEPGSRRRELYVVRSGEVRLEPAEGGPPRLIGPGDCFGELPAILGEPHRERARADSEVVLQVVELPLLNRLCSENAEFAMRLVRRLAERLAGREPGGARERKPSREALLNRMAEVILERCEQADPPAQVRGKLRDLAQHAGVDMRDAYSVLHEWLDERVLRLADDQLVLIQPDALKIRARSR
jgi:CRP-like cAMP-binding protein